MDKRFNYITIHSSKNRYILLPFLAVFVGGFIYILFRPTEAGFLKWFGIVGTEDLLYAAREKSLSIYSFLPDWIVYSLPNGLWAFAYTIIVLRIWKGSNSIVKYFWFLSIPVLVFGFELLQLTGNVQGTYCWSDMLWGALGIILGLLTLYKIKYNLNLLR